jgi:hypothetical protein
VRAVPSILHTVGVNWNSRSEIDTAYTGKCDVALNNKQENKKKLLFWKISSFQATIRYPRGISFGALKGK